MKAKKHLNLRIPLWWASSPGWRRLARALTPHPGTLIVTLVVVAAILWAQSVGALPLRAPLAASTSTGTIAYQGRLTDADGNPLTDTYNMVFRLYDVASGGVPLWEEQWTGSNSVQASDGVFNVTLGSLTPIPQSVITGHDSLFLGITVGTDDEMTPRVQLGSVPFAVQALTVPDGSITTEKIADGAVTSVKLANDLAVNGDFTVDGIVYASNLDRGYTAYGIGDGAKPIRQICKVACGGPDSDDNYGDYWIWDAGIFQTSTGGAWHIIGGWAHTPLCNGCAVVCTCQPYRSW